MKRFVIVPIALTFIATSFAMPAHKLEKVRGGYKLTIDMPEAVIREVEITDVLQNGLPVNETFSCISISGFAQDFDQVGGPQLLRSSFKLAIENEVPQVIIEDLVVDKIALTKPLFPVQQPHIYEPNYRKPYFAYDKQLYSSLRNTPFVSISEPFYIRGQKGVSVAVSPVTYDHASQTVTVVKRITVLFSMEPLTCVKSKGSRHFDRYIRAVFHNLNDDCDRLVPSETFREREKYVIIVADNFIDNPDLKTFIDFRSTKYDVAVSSVTDLGGNNPATFNAYLTQEQPTFALFVGKYQDFYFYQGVEPMNNNWTYTYVYYQSYGQMDPHPDFHLGLFFCRTDAALKNAVAKTIHTANNLDKMGKGYVAFTGHDMEFGPGKYHIEELFDKFENDYWSNMDIDLTKIYVARNPECDADICVSKMNEGIRFINYNGHGWEYGWVYKQEPDKVNWTTKYGLENWGSIENTVYPFVFSCACLSGNFMYEGQNGGGPECWAETWIGHERMGTACIASQAPSSFNQHALNRGMIQCLYKKEMTQIAVMMDYAKEYTYDSLGTYFGNLGAQEYHLFGCPASETFWDGTTEVQHTITENLSSDISLVKVTKSAVTLSIPENDHYMISLFKANGQRIDLFSSRLRAGYHTIPVIQNRLSHNLYLLSVKSTKSNLVKKVLF